MALKGRQLRVEDEAGLLKSLEKIAENASDMLPGFMLGATHNYQALAA